MIPSPLRLIKYYFTRLEFHCDQEPEEKHSCVQSSLDFAVDANNARNWRVRLLIEDSGDKAVKKGSYHYAFEIVGFFSVREQFPEEKIRGMVAANASAMLYGTVREMAMTLSLRTRCGELILPTVSFIDVAVEEAKKESAQKSLTGNSEGDSAVKNAKPLPVAVRKRETAKEAKKEPHKRTKK